MPDKKPIAALESEQEVLGAVLNQPSKLLDIIDILTPEDFYRTDHRHIYRAMKELLEADTPIELSTISAYLTEKGVLDQIGGKQFLVALETEIGVGSKINHHVQQIHEKSTLRRLQTAALTIAKNCENGKGTNTREIVEQAQALIAEVEAGAKFKSDKNITKRIREYAEVTEGNIEVTKLYKSLQMVTTGNKKAALVAIGRLVKEGVLAKIKPGYYRVIEKDAPRIKLSEAKNMGNEIPVRYPFGLQKWFVTYPKTVILVSGEPDSGKTAFLLNVARLNMHLAPVYYWTSEMGPPELLSRVENFEDYNPDEWDEKIQFHERSENFADVVAMHPDALHIIDNLEMNDEFYRVGGLVDDIWKALGRGVAVIGLHKDPGKSWGLGGMGSAKRPRLYLALEPKKSGGNIMQVKKFKNWRDKHTNIKDKTFEFKLVKGCRIIEWE